MTCKYSIFDIAPIEQLIGFNEIGFTYVISNGHIIGACIEK